MRARGQRGMATVELAMISLVVAGLVALVVWFGAQLIKLDSCQVAAHEIARQSARGDATAVRRASAGVPVGATVQIVDAAGATTVTVKFSPRLLGFSVGTLAAHATVLDEARP